MLHQRRSGSRGGGDGDVVGISWKAPTRSHPSPSLVVTCPHQVVVYKVSEPTWAQSLVSRPRLSERVLAANEITCSLPAALPEI